MTLHIAALADSYHSFDARVRELLLDILPKAKAMRDAVKSA